jgi:hypothetical protein
MDTKAVVFETPAIDVKTSSGINLIAGDITATAERDGGKVRFTLRVVSGTLDLIFDRDRKVMIWPGLDADTFRPTLIHSCTVIPPRSILSFRALDSIQNPISVRCEDDKGSMYFTMDAASKRAIFERGPIGSLYEGVVAAVDDDEIALDMKFGRSRRVVWSKSRKTITIEDGNATKPHTVMLCQEVAPRTMIVYHARLSPR